MADPYVTFDAATHRYRMAGFTVPSVTQVLAPLQDFGGIPAEVLARAAEFGTHVHQAIALWLRGVLDEAALDPALAPYLRAAQKFMRESGFKVLGSEMLVYSEAHQFAGTLDLFGELHGFRTIVDYKTALMTPRTVGPQLAGYALALRESHKQPKVRRYCVRLMPDDYRLERLSDPADQTIFLSCLNIAKWRQRNG